MPAPESMPATMRLLSDDRLARRAARGDRRAFEAIYQRYHQDLYRFCLAMIGNPQDAQDALQSTMVKVLRALPGEERQIKLKPWLYRIARNETIEIVRRRRDSEELSVNQPAASTLAETTEARERLRTLLEDLEQLPQRQRAMLLMRELSGLEFAEIGAAFGTSAAVARQTLYEARISLRQLEEGRNRHCAEVRRELSEADGRTIRRRKLRAHLRVCPSCRAFQEEMTRRREDLAALAPLPLAAAADLLRGTLGSSSGAAANVAAGGGLGGAIGAGKAIATSAVVKSAATVAAVAVVGVSAVDRGGAIDLPLPGQSNDRPARVIPETTGPVPQGAENAVRASGGLGSPAKPGDSGSPQGTRSEEKLDEDGSATAASGKATADAESSPSQAGQTPPGGGHGRSSAERQGRPDHLPSASEKGQQTAAAHKPAQAASPPGHSGATPGGGKPAGTGGTAVNKPASPPKAQTPQAPPAELPSQAPGAKAGVAHGPPGSPPGLER